MHTQTIANGSLDPLCASCFKLDDVSCTCSGYNKRIILGVSMSTRKWNVFMWHTPKTYHSLECLLTANLICLGFCHKILPCHLHRPMCWNTTSLTNPVEGILLLGQPHYTSYAKQAFSPYACTSLCTSCRSKDSVQWANTYLCRWWSKPSDVNGDRIWKANLIHTKMVMNRYVGGDDERRQWWRWQRQ